MHCYRIIIGRRVSKQPECGVAEEPVQHRIQATRDFECVSGEDEYFAWPIHSTFTFHTVVGHQWLYKNGFTKCAIDGASRVLFFDKNRNRAINWKELHYVYIEDDKNSNYTKANAPNVISGMPIAGRGRMETHRKHV